MTQFRPHRVHPLPFMGGHHSGVQECPTYNERWLNDGKIRLSLGEDRDVKGAFLLSIDKASRLMKTLELAITDHEITKAEMWRN